MVGPYRLTGPILAICNTDGHHEAITIPAGALVDLDGKTFNGDRLMEVLWNGRKVLMFTEELKSKTVPT